MFSATEDCELPRAHCLWSSCNYVHKGAKKSSDLAPNLRCTERQIRLLLNQCPSDKMTIITQNYHFFHAELFYSLES